MALRDHFSNGKGETTESHGPGSSPPGPIGATANWKPIYLRWPYLCLLIAIHLLHIVGIQVLVSQNKKDQSKIDLVQSNTTIVSNPRSIFIFDDWDAGPWFAFQYLPVAIAVLLGIMWEGVDLSVRRMEPYYQLSQPLGAVADDALTLDYVHMFTWKVPVVALSKKHTAVALSSIGYIVAASLVPTFTGSTFKTHWPAEYAAGTTRHPFWATVQVRTAFSTTACALHGAGIVLALVLLWTLQWRQSGLYRSPTGIGGLASLIADSDFIAGASTLAVLRQIPSYASNRVVEAALRGIHFKLEHTAVIYSDGSRVPSYTLLASVPAGYQLPHPPPREYYRNRRDASSVWLMRRTIFTVFCVTWMFQGTLTGIIVKVADFTTGSDDLGSQNKLLISRTLFTFLLTVGAAMWMSIQRDVQALEPWRELAVNSRSSSSFYDALVRNDYVSAGLFITASTALVRRGAVSAWVAFATLAIHLATIWAPPMFDVVYGSMQTGNYEPPTWLRSDSRTPGYWVAAVLLIGGYVVMGLNALFLSMSGRCKPVLPRRPSTIASALVYLCRSDRLLRDLLGTSLLGEDDLRGKLGMVAGTCRFGFFWWGRAGTWFVGVEETVNDNREGGYGPFNWNVGITGWTPCT